ncbi:MAG: class I SAM-dependent methyltransferase [Candidatus Eisenbacteria sp.]|nr:class I SAM-dependent methyltransferase [Candidatus Eisenbacteria bacterium]
METGQVSDTQIATEHHVCPWQRVRHIDNFLRPLLHNPRKLFEPYVRQGMRVLDLGCGGGFASLGLARLVGEDGLVIAADLQPEMLRMVEEKAARAGLSERIRVHRCEADRVGVRDKLDFVLAFWMVHELPDTPAFFREMLGQLGPGGALFIAEPKFHVSRRDLEHAVQEAQDAGFIVSGRPSVRFSRAVVLRREITP